MNEGAVVELEAVQVPPGILLRVMGKTGSATHRAGVLGSMHGFVHIQALIHPFPGRFNAQAQEKNLFAIPFTSSSDTLAQDSG